MMLYEGLAKLGLELYVPNPADRLPTVTTIKVSNSFSAKFGIFSKVPEGFPWAKVNSYLMDKYALEVAGGLGPSAGQVWRIGLMGYNATEANVKLVLEKFEEAMKAAQA